MLLLLYQLHILFIVFEHFHTFTASLFLFNEFLIILKPHFSCILPSYLVGNNFYTAASITFVHFIILLWWSCLWFINFTFTDHITQIICIFFLCWAHIFLRLAGFWRSFFTWPGVKSLIIWCSQLIFHHFQLGNVSRMHLWGIWFCRYVSFYLIC